MDKEIFRAKVKEVFKDNLTEEWLDKKIDSIISNLPSLIEDAEDNYGLSKTFVGAILEVRAKEISATTYGKGFNDSYVRKNRKDSKLIKSVI